MNPSSAPPPDWTTGLSPLAILGALVGVGGAVYSAAQATAAVLRGELLGATTAAGLTFFFAASMAALALTLRASTKSAADWDDEGTTVRVNPSIALAYGGALLGGAVGSASYLLLIAQGSTSLPFAAPGRDFATRILMVALLLLTVIGLVALIRSREPGRLRLGPNGIEHADMFRTRRARWDAVVDVADKADKRSRNPIVFAVSDDKPIVVANADRYGNSGAALYWMVRYYWTHPESRDELSDGRALARLRSDGFEAG